MAKQIMFEKVREDYYKLFAYSQQLKEWVYLDEYHTKDITRVVEQLNTIL